MKRIELVAPPRKIVAVLGTGGGLWLWDTNSNAPRFINQYGVVSRFPAKTGQTLADLVAEGRRPVYEGDTLTITF